MRSILLLIFLAPSIAVFSQKSEAETLSNRIAKEAHLKDSSSHMLDSLELASFIGLDYFDFDSSYQIEATFTKDKGPKFEMPTSTTRLPIYRRYGYLTFSIDSVTCTLTVYQNMELRKEKEYKDYLFIPFRDATSAKSTYGGGRYLDARIPEGKSMLLDFNQAYNPYCAYSYKFSCPIPPKENTLEVAIEAGEKIPLAH